jgi:putative membrane protein
MHFLQSFILHLLANAAGLYVVDYVVPDFCFVTDRSLAACPADVEAGIWAFVIGGFVLGLLNVFVKPVLKLISMPINFLSMGLFMFVVNAVVLALLVWLVNTLTISSTAILVAGNSAWLTYLYAAIVLGLFNLATHWLVKSR